MNPRDERLRAIFHAALEMTSESRERMLAEVGAEDPTLREELESLLDADRAEATGLSGPCAALPRAGGGMPSSIGPYTILGIVGEGGMGVVFRGRESGALRRLVAVKVLRPELSTTSAIGRFEAEREALALMDHPNVARVFDAGATPGGRLYIAMEFVDGTPITAYCDSGRLDVRARLALFLQVCDGVQHAHERGVIHRDLNPSNVLVAESDGGPVAKIIDFGIAKLVRDTTAGRGPRTESGILVGTPEYMSPEQVTMRPGTGDTRTDVWALGLLLYELLVGLLPYDVERLRASGLAGLRTAILEQPLPSPWTRLRAADSSAAEAIATARSGDRRSLLRGVRGDLGRVALKAIERDRARRYASPNELAADVRRHLREEPVLAGSPGVVYRLACFARRHRRAIAASTAVVALAGSAAIAAGLQARRAAEETERARRDAALARELSSFVVNFMTTPSSVARRIDRADAESIIDAGSLRVLRALDTSPALRAQLLHAFGDAQRRFGRFQAASPLLEEAAGRLDELVGSESPEALAAKDSLARLRQDAGELDVAERLFRESYETRRRVAGDDDPESLRALSRLAFCLWRSNAAERAEPLLARCAAGMARVLGPDHPETLVVTSYRIGGLIAVGRAAEALALADDLLPRARSELGPTHVETLGSGYNRACALARLGRLDEAIDGLRETVEAGFFLGSPMAEDPDLAPLREHPEFAAIARLGGLNSPAAWEPTYAEAMRLRRVGRHRDSELLLGELQEAARRCGAGRGDVFDIDYLLADVVFLQGRAAEAEPIVAALDEEVMRAPWETWYPTAEFAAFRAQCRLARGDRQGATAWLDEAAARLRRTPQLGIAAYVESRRKAISGEHAEAARLLEEARARGYDLTWWLARDAIAGRS